MIRIKAAQATKADRIQEIYKAQKKKKIREKYEVELAALRAGSFFLHLGPISSPLLGRVLGLLKSQLSLTNSNLSSPIHVVFSDSNLEIEDTLFDDAPELPSPIPQ